MTMSDPQSTDVSSLGDPVAIPFKTRPCGCVTRHHPHPRFNHLHHIVPLSWGGSDDPSNIIALCPTSHENIHMNLRKWVAAGKPLKTNLTPFVLDLAMRAWKGRAHQEALSQ